MTEQQLRDELQRRGVALWVEDGQLRYRAPRGALDIALREAIVTHKPSLLTKLTADAPSSEADAATTSQTAGVASGEALLPLLSFLPGTDGMHRTERESAPVPGNHSNAEETGDNAVTCSALGCNGAPFLRDSAGGWWCDPHFARGLLVNAAVAAGLPPLDDDAPVGDIDAWREYAAMVARLEVTPETARLRVLADEQGRGSKESKGRKAEAPWHDKAIPSAGTVAFNPITGELDPILVAAGYRLCRVCHLLTVHRTICLRCSPRAVLPPVRHVRGQTL